MTLTNKHLTQVCLQGCQNPKLTCRHLRNDEMDESKWYCQKLQPGVRSMIDRNVNAVLKSPHAGAVKMPCGISSFEACQLPTAEAVGLPFQLQATFNSGLTDGNRPVETARAAMFFAALWSAFSVCPQILQQNSAWLLRFDFSQ